MKVVEDVFPLCLQIGLPEVQSVQQALHQDCQLSVKEVGFKWEFLLRIRAWLSVFGLQKVSWFQSVLFIFQNFPKNQRKIWQISAPESKKWSNHKIKAPYSVFNISNSLKKHDIIRKCLYFVDLTTFIFLDRNLSNFSLVFCKI